MSLAVVFRWHYLPSTQHDSTRERRVPLPAVPLSLRLAQGVRVTQTRIVLDQRAEMLRFVRPFPSGPNQEMIRIDQCRHWAFSPAPAIRPRLHEPTEANQTIEYGPIPTTPWPISFYIPSSGVYGYRQR